jgi:sugar/nucleoside kinase (ribokinase family)
MHYIVAGPSIVNNICEKQGTTINRIIGGSVYCVAGLLLWTESVLYVSRVGADFDEYFSKWIRNNHVTVEGIIQSLPYTHYSTLSYTSGGEYVETSIYGKGYEEYAYPASRLNIDDIARHCSAETKGIYIEVNEDEKIWNHLSEIRTKTNASILWEVPTTSVSSAVKQEMTLEKIGLVDVFSINIPEGEILFKTMKRDVLLQRIQSLAVPCFLRAGSEGSYWICHAGIFFAPSVLIGPVVDPTGCGNASTAAALYAFAEKYDPAVIPMVANISAAFTILQYGPYPTISEKERVRAQELLKKISHN